MPSFFIFFFLFSSSVMRHQNREGEGFNKALFLNTFYLQIWVTCLARGVWAGGSAVHQGSPVKEGAHPTLAREKSPGRQMWLPEVWKKKDNVWWGWTPWHHFPCQGFETPLSQKGFVVDISPSKEFDRYSCSAELSFADCSQSPLNNAIVI